MAVFHYLVKNDEGARSEGDIRADTMDLALQKLTSNGQIVITLKEVDTTFDFLGPFLDEINLTFERLKNRVPLANIVFFTRQLHVTGRLLSTTRPTCFSDEYPSLDRYLFLDKTRSFSVLYATNIFWWKAIFC